MAVRRRRPASKASHAPTSRVHTVETLEQFQTMLAKAAASKKVVCLQFFQAQNYTCAQMRAYYRRMSVDPALKAAVFAEVEVDSAEEELLAECGLLAGRGKIPCYRCYVAGEEVESYAGGTPTEVAKMVARQLAQLKGSGGGLLAKLLLAAGAAAAAAAAAYWHLGRRQGGGGGGGDAGGLAAEMRSLSERIGIAQQRLSNAERAGRLKAAKNQRRLLQQLRARQRSLEQQLHQRQHPGGGGAGAGGAGRAAAEAASDAEEEAAERREERQQRRRRRAASPSDYSSDEEWAAALARPAVLYSDEE